jgi:hypothetical protein
MTIQPFGGIRLSVGAVRQGWYSIDNRGGNDADLTIDLECYPWPLPASSVIQAYAGHVVNRIDPARFGFIRFMNELWRLLVPNGELIVVSYYGTNQRYAADPAACNSLTEASFYWFDPTHKSGLWQVYQPHPWQIRDLVWDVAGNLEVLLGKR